MEEHGGSDASKDASAYMLDTSLETVAKTDEKCCFLVQSIIIHTEFSNLSHTVQ